MLCLLKYPRPLSSCCTVCTEAEWFCFAGQVEPFTSVLPEGLFNMSRFLLHCMEEGTPRGVSKAYPSLLLFGVRHIIHYVSCCSHLPVRQSIQTHYPYVSCCSHLPVHQSIHIIHMLVVSVNPSRHIIHNYVSCCSHLPVHQSVQTHYPYVSCCSHLPVHQSIHQCPCWILPAPVLSRQGLSPLLLCLFSVKSWGLFREVTLSAKKRKAKRWVG